MNPLTKFFPETDGLSLALRKQSERISHDMQCRQLARDLGPEPKDWDRLRSFERGQHPVGDGLSAYRISEADCRQVKAKPEEAKAPAVNTPAAKLADTGYAASGDALIGFKKGDSSDERTAFEAWIDEERPHGREEQVQHAWASSQARVEWLKSQQPQPDADGWIPFECTATSVCQVPDGLEFEARLRDGRIMKGVSPWLDWGRLYKEGSAGDIVAYRILTPKPAEPPLAVGDLVEVLPHPEGGRHPAPLWDPSDDLWIGKRGSIVSLSEDGGGIVSENGAVNFLPISALRRKPSTAQGDQK